MHIQFADNFSSGTLDRWQFPYPEDWVIGTDGPLHYLPPAEPRAAPSLPRIA